jgi:NAD(P)-dependent dehydrogenase (short-subunit alcohol dehydrogenase family)
MKKVLITGASSSIGKFIVEHFKEAGYKLVLHYNSHIPEVDGAEYIQADLSEPEGVQKLLNEAEKLAPFDVIINNANCTGSRTIDNLEAWERMFRVDTFLPALLMVNGKRLVRESGCFVNISSIYGDERVGSTSNISYSAAKASLNSLTRTFAKKLAPEIRVNAVSPGYVDSKWNADYSEEQKAKLAKDQLTEKLVQPGEVAKLVMHIVDNPSINGEVIIIDGGLSLRTV